MNHTEHGAITSRHSSMNAKRIAKNPVRWVTVWQVWHWRAKKYIRPHDGQPFRFPMHLLAPSDSDGDG